MPGAPKHALGKTYDSPMVPSPTMVNDELEQAFEPEVRPQKYKLTPTPSPAPSGYHTPSGRNSGDLGADSPTKDASPSPRGSILRSARASWSDRQLQNGHDDVAKQLSLLSLSGDSAPQFGRDDASQRAVSPAGSETTIEGIYGKDWNAIKRDTSTYSRHIEEVGSRRRSSVYKRVRVVSPRRTQTPPPKRGAQAEEDASERPSIESADKEGASLWTQYGPTLGWLYGTEHLEHPGSDTSSASKKLSDLDSDEGDGKDLARELCDEIRAVFMDFLKEVESADVSRPPDDDDDPNGGHELSRALLAAPLLNRLGQCHDAVRSELVGEELKLWHAFIVEDADMTGTVDVRNSTLRSVLRPLASNEEEIDSWVVEVQEVVAPDHRATFVDLLAWWHDASLERSISLTSRASYAASSLVSVVSLGFLGGESAENIMDASKKMTKLLEKRGVELSRGELYDGVSQYERIIVDTCGYKCECTLSGTWRETGFVAGVDLLVSILCLIHSMLTPVERILWSLFGSVDDNFDGAYSFQEALSGVGDVVALTEDEEHARAPDGEDNEEELTQLRSSILREAVEDLFKNPNLCRRQGTVSFADLLVWWEDLTDEFRAASGLHISKAALKQSRATNPSQIFKEQLANITGDRLEPALRGHCRLFGELHVNRLRESFNEMWGVGGKGSDSDSTSETSSAGNVQDMQESSPLMQASTKSVPKENAFNPPARTASTPSGNAESPGSDNYKF